jgi:hypothetical protein
MHRLLAALLLMSLSAACWAAEDAKPNTLTPKEIAEGWLLLFDGETNFGWTPATDVKAEKGLLLLGHGREVIPQPTTWFHNFELVFDYRVLKGNDRDFIRMKADAFGEFDNELPVPKGENWHSVRYVVQGKDYDLWIRHKDKELAHYFAARKVSSQEHFAFVVRKDVQLAIRNVKLKPLAMKSLFNGKDLTGWKEFPGKKSKFSVTKEGWLNIKDGPGDLQTTGQWADFVLQLECRTNGDNLNSGVFFRCIPGQYQNGYEAQIHNQRAEEPKSYTIEEYDAKTHQLTGKKKIDNWSRDYGTGAIYRRIPARRALAKDREWFTMTVVVQDRHMATWVNGIQATDWDDYRPTHENPRNGFRRKKGAISLQGHDPTTDLSFRNIRLAGWDEKD